MKKIFFAAVLSLMTVALNAATTWTETCGTTVSQSGTYWPYVNQFTGWDHQGECTYNGSYATVRQLNRYAANGPHVYLASSKDTYFTIDGIPGGSSATLSFDMVFYNSSNQNLTSTSASMITLSINGIEQDLSAFTITSTAFSTISIPIEGMYDTYSLRFAKPSTEKAEVRLDNFTITYGEKKYTLTVIAGKGGTVNTEVNGEYSKGAKVTVTATPNADYTFVQWSDGNTNATREITITEDLILRAEFKGNYNTVADIMKIYQDLNLASGATSTESYTGRGYVTKWNNGYPDYQNADFYVDDYADGSQTLLQCFRLTASNAADKRTLKVGEYVEFTGKLQNYNGRAEIAKGGTFRVLEAPADDEEQSGCYKDYEGMRGAQIVAALHELIKDPDTVPYKNLRADLTGIDYRTDGKVWDMYSPCDFGPKGYCTTVESPDECSCYNREHMVPQSWWNNVNTERMRTDLHHVIPADGFTNEKRSNNPYGEVMGTPDWTNTVGSKLGKGTYNTTVFEPNDEYKGDIARAYFYMLTCYSDKDFTQHWKGQKVFTFTNGKAGLTSEAQSLFLKWHRNDPVSDKEIKRNNGIEALQHNRNPFIDMPELIEYIWGKNSAKVYTCSTTAIESIEEAMPRATKLIENGALYIVLPDGTRYTTTGARVR